LRKQVAALGLTGRVEITSVRAGDRAAMARLLARASLVTLLSEYEAHPIAVMEALALGRPVLVAYTSGLAELADRGMVGAVPLDSRADEVARAVLEGLDRPVGAMSLRLPTWDECAADLLRLYYTVTGWSPCAS
jgi:glycosyltransferase involved in cell wall biosynthesis